MTKFVLRLGLTALDVWMRGCCLVSVCHNLVLGSGLFEEWYSIQYCTREESIRMDVFRRQSSIYRIDDKYKCVTEIVSTKRKSEVTLLCIDPSLCLHVRHHFVRVCNGCTCSECGTTANHSNCPFHSSRNTRAKFKAVGIINDGSPADPRATFGRNVGHANAGQLRQLAAA